MNENEFLISRALGVFNPQYGRNIKMEDCEIRSIATDPQNDRAYEISTPRSSDFFRIHLYVKFSDMDRDLPARLEVAMPYIHGGLGDEVYVILSFVANMWRNSGYRFDPIEVTDVPFGCIVQEDQTPIITEAGRFMIMEYAV